nr:hypothetical protein [Tanacetum cinerariifolium]
MDLFGPTFVKILNKKSYYVVVTDDFSMFTWVFFLATKDETSPILKTFITGIENQLSLKVKIIRSNNGTEFKNQDLNQFCGMKGIKREFSDPITPQQIGIAKKIDAAKTMLADSLLPIAFWVEAVNIACYVQNRVLVTKPYNKTPCELLLGRTPSICFMRPFSCHVTILNTLDPLGKFDGKADEGFLVGYSNTDGDAAFEVKEPEFDGKKLESEVHVSPSSSAQTKKHDDKTKREAKGKSPVELSTGYRNVSVEFEDFSVNSINEDKAIDSSVPVVGKISTNITKTFSAAGPSNTAVTLEDITYSDDEEHVSAEADFTNLETNITVSPIPTTRVHKDHHVTQIIGDLSSATQTRSMTRVVKDQALKDPSWIEAMQEELLQFKMEKEEGINYEEVFAPVARIEAIRLFLAYASFMGFMVYQMDVKSDFLYGTIEEEVYVCQPSGFEDPGYPDKVYVDDIIFGSTNKDLCKAFEKLMKDKFQMSSIVKRIFMYLKGKPHLGLWYLNDSPFNLVAYSDSDYVGASLDRKSTIGGCQFFRCKLITWQCKKQTVVATSSTEAEYVAAASCCA